MKRWAEATFLLEVGWDPNSISHFDDEDGNLVTCPMNAAITMKNMDLIIFLLKMKAKIPETALLLATNFFPEAFGTLVKNGASPNSIYMEQTPLLRAIWSGSENKVVIVLENGGDPNLVVDGWPPLFYSVKRDLASISKILIEHGAETTFLDADERSIRDIAVINHASNCLALFPQKQHSARGKFQPGKEVRLVNNEPGLVTGDHVNLRASPEISPRNRILAILMNEKVIKLEEKEGADGELWCKVKIQRGKIGWIPSGFFGKVKARIGYLSDDVNNVRSGPGLGFKIVDQPQRGTKVIILEEHEKWRKIRYWNSRIGWSHKSNLRKIK